jgi:hypothetical protein
MEHAQVLRSFSSRFEAKSGRKPKLEDIRSDSSAWAAFQAIKNKNSTQKENQQNREPVVVIPDTPPKEQKPAARSHAEASKWHTLEEDKKDKRTNKRVLLDDFAERLAERLSKKRAKAGDENRRRMQDEKQRMHEQRFSQCVAKAGSKEWLEKTFLIGTKNEKSPRVHQIDAVYKLLQAVEQEEKSSSYLVQHAAGSGKSLTMALLALHLALTADNANVAPINQFRLVVLLTDRNQLDQQLGNTVRQFLHRNGFFGVVCVEESNQLKDLLTEVLGLPGDEVDEPAARIGSTKQKRKMSQAQQAELERQRLRRQRQQQNYSCRVVITTMQKFSAVYSKVHEAERKRAKNRFNPKLKSNSGGGASDYRKGSSRIESGNMGGLGGAAVASREAAAMGDFSASMQQPQRSIVRVAIVADEAHRYTLYTIHYILYTIPD